MNTETIILNSGNTLNVKWLVDNLVYLMFLNIFNVHLFNIHF